MNLSNNFGHTKLLMPSYLWLQLQYIRDNKSAYNGGYFAGTSKNKYYAKKQHRDFIKKHLNNKIEFFTVHIN